MKRHLLATVLAALALSSLATPAPASAAVRYIVVLKDTTDQVAATAQEHAQRFDARLGHLYNDALKGYSAVIPEHRVDEVQADPRVAFVSADREVSVDPQPEGPGGKGKTPPPPPPQTTPTGIDRVDAELSPTAGIDRQDNRVNADVAILDTGVDVDHPDLNVVGGVNCTGGSSSYDDGNGHGTHVAGTVAAIDNAIGVVGVAPGARLWAVKVLNRNGSGSWSDVICGIDWVTANAATIEAANMSLSGPGTDDGNCGNTNNDALHRAICASVDAGVTYAVAAGNQAIDAANRTPGAYDEVITVSALADFDGRPGGLGAATCRSDVDDTFANFSNYGLDVDLIAPGVCINSTFLGGTYRSDYSGTSMATPHVAGAAALYKVVNPLATPLEVKTGLQLRGGLDWTGDPDLTKEPLLNVRGL